MFPTRLCALCSTKIRRNHERLCPQHCNTFKEQLVWDEQRRAYRVGDLTEAWLKSIIEYSEYEFNLQLRDYGRTIPLEKVGKI